jgi:hypothetical protein
MGQADLSDKTIGKSGQNLEAKSTAKFSHLRPQICRFPTGGLELSPFVTRPR